MKAISPTQQFGDAAPGGVFSGGFWSGSAQSWTGLPGSGDIKAVAGDQLAGWAAHPGGGHAAIWAGPSHTLIDLHVAGYNSSGISATTGTTQAGGVAGLLSGSARAAIWHGSAASAVILHPPGGYDSTAYAADGDYQGGWVRYANPPGQPGQYHAALWSGTAQSFMDLHPVGHLGSLIRGMGAGQLVGTVDGHAALWPSIGAPYIDLDPSWVSGAELYATCGTAQVGVAVAAGYGSTAGVWFGTADSFVPLGQFLPSNYRASVATCVASDASGLLYIGGYATNDITNAQEAVMWMGVPAPGTLGLLAPWVTLAARRRRAAPGRAG